MHEAIRYRENPNWEAVTSNIRQVVRDYCRTANLNVLVLGESGGVDSALTSALVRPVCDELGIRLVGRSLTIETNKPDERQRAEAVGRAFCHDFREVDLTALYLATRDAIEELPVEEDRESRAYKLRMGNVKARLRMVYLYNLAQRYRGMVLSTDNHTEWMLGFWTLHGDVGDFDPLFGLWKTEVYKLAKHLLPQLDTDEQRAALEACIACTPTDGLGITSSDVEQLGAKNYSEVDGALIAWLHNESNAINPAVVARHKASEFKRRNPKFVTREEMFNRSNNKSK